MSYQLGVCTMHLLISTTVPKRVKLNPNVCQKNVLQSHVDTQQGRRSIRIADAARPKSHLLRLPKEIRAMILEYLFAMLTGAEIVTFDPLFSSSGAISKEHLRIVLHAQKDRLILPIFFVCKALSGEAQEVFWSTTTFSCQLWDEDGSSLMHFCMIEQKFPPRRRPNTIPRQFPLHRIRYLDIRMKTDYVHPVHILEGLWELAKLAHPQLEVNFFYKDVYSAHDTEPHHTIESELANWLKIKEY